MRNILKEVEGITVRLLEAGLLVVSNYPKIIDGAQLVWSSYRPNANLLKNLPYHQKYAELVRDNNYSFMFLDGGIVQIGYSFDSSHSTIIGHRLAYYPSTNLAKYQDDPDGYEKFLHTNYEYFVLTDEHVVSTSLRFDYDPLAFEQVVHPHCHLHIGELENCRIPINRSITPSDFINFILRNFYASFVELNDARFSFIPTRRTDVCIDRAEKKIIHLSIE
jgi:hypothetical protein